MTLYIVARGIEQGTRGALVAVLGVQTAHVLHIVVAVLGVSALLASSSLAFDIMKYSGAAYLMGLGIRAILDAADQPGDLAPPARSLWRTFAQSVTISVLNPLTTLFYLAFLPAFVDPVQGAASTQFVKLGLMHICFGFVVKGGYALVAGSIRTGLMDRALSVRTQGWIVGGVYGLIGSGMAVSSLVEAHIA